MNLYQTVRKRWHSQFLVGKKAYAKQEYAWEDIFQAPFHFCFGMLPYNVPKWPKRDCVNWLNLKIFTHPIRHSWTCPFPEMCIFDPFIPSVDQRPGRFAGGWKKSKVLVPKDIVKKRLDQSIVSIGRGEDARPSCSLRTPNGPSDKQKPGKYFSVLKDHRIHVNLMVKTLVV